MKHVFVAAMTVSAGLAPMWSCGAAEALVAKISVAPKVYAGKLMVMDGTGSTEGAGVTYQWQAKGAQVEESRIEKGSMIKAGLTPPAWGPCQITLTVQRGSEKAEAKANVAVLNDPTVDNSPSFPGATKVLYKEAPDALGGKVKLYLHVFYPAGWKATDKRPVVVHFHGGGWNAGSPERHVPDATYWSTRGIVGITAQYRLGHREGVGPELCVADAKSAIRYVRAHAAELGIDPDRIAAGGQSAGAHIAACAGTVPAYSDAKDDLKVSCVPNALLLYYPYSMVTTRGNGKDDMSPLNFVGANTPPTFFLGGELDRIAPAEKGFEWGEKMKANGGKNAFKFIIYRKKLHPSGKTNIHEPGTENDMIRQTDLFLESLGFLEGPPTVEPMDGKAIEALHMDLGEFRGLRPR